MIKFLNLSTSCRLKLERLCNCCLLQLYGVLVLNEFFTKFLVFGAHVIENFGFVGVCPFGGHVVLVGGLCGLFGSLGLWREEDVECLKGFRSWRLRFLVLVDLG